MFPKIFYGSFALSFEFTPEWKPALVEVGMACKQKRVNANTNGLSSERMSSEAWVSYSDKLRRLVVMIIAPNNNNRWLIIGQQVYWIECSMRRGS